MSLKDNGQDDLATSPISGIRLEEANDLGGAPNKEMTATQVRSAPPGAPPAPPVAAVAAWKDYQEHVVATLFGQVGVSAPVCWPPLQKAVSNWRRWARFHDRLSGIAELR